MGNRFIVRPDHSNKREKKKKKKSEERNIDHLSVVTKYLAYET